MKLVKDAIREQYTYRKIRPIIHLVAHPIVWSQVQRYVELDIGHVVGKVWMPLVDRTVFNRWAL